jgi:thymidylate synthase
MKETPELGAREIWRRTIVTSWWKLWLSSASAAVPCSLQTLFLLGKNPVKLL